MNILFVVNQIDFADHIAIGYLSAIAKSRGHKTYLCVLKSHNLLEKITQYQPKIIAYSANVIGFDQIVASHKQAKEKYQFISIMGGPQATFSPETFSQSGMDAYCVGEGEYTFRDFIERVEENKDFSDLANLITQAGVREVRPLIKNLDELPLVDRDLTITNTNLKNVPKKTFYATRGCPFKCSYCCNNYYHELYKGKGPIVRRFSVERLLNEIEQVKSKYRMDFVKFGDDLFALRADAWLEEFTKKYSKRIKIPFNCYLRLDTVSDDLLKLLKESGCYSVHLSLDSTSQYIREKIFERNMQSENSETKLRKIREYGINTWVNYMLAAPESKLEDDLETIRFSRRARVNYPAYSTTVPMKGTKLYDYCLEKGYLDPKIHKSDMTECSRASVLSCFGKKDKKIRYNIYLMGALVAKLPFPFYQLGLWAIKVIPPNSFFKFVRQTLYNYYISNKIFLLTKKGLKHESAKN